MTIKLPAMSAISAPIPLPPDRVTRPDRGGALLESFRSGGTAALVEPTTHGVDGHRPEEWLASTVRAWSAVGKPLTDEGLTVVRDDGRDVTLREIVQRRQFARLVGSDLMRVAGPTTGLLVRLVDAAERTPVHCHPSRGFAERFLGSRFGGTKAWLVLGTRQVPGAPPPRIFLGFRQTVERAELQRSIADGATDALLESMHQRPVASGDVWFIPAGLPHAIGAGVLLVELGEPADFSIVAETADFAMAARDAHLGMGWNVMVDAFDGRGWSDEEVAALRQQPTSAESEPPMQRYRLLGRATEAYVRAERLSVAGGSGVLPWSDTLVVGIVLDGEGEVMAPGGSLRVTAGDAFAVPAGVSDSTRLVAERSLTLLCCLPPDAEALAATGWRRPVPAT
ncbi:MAG: hypothetical protein ACR2LP_03215 [Candidatus Limnocylindrales bacterium]